ncbi:hypothetical protein [Nitrosomonas mobilis]|jgi:membrane associated rhomboid family serine protease|uniref:Uncharacterized protein n=1 Tax=Nitrosomonas mobilis TaxID=51642 RepID=A0A1G5SCV9_9PROT|nr:hypothetical protein [Nitrosomonas mobilis]SCZ85025.1 hypothetical protein NSMM_330045 [Nitrosomonas mobilis]HNO76226.1 hypothetical protein [Nitrosomonas mobilis]
MNKPIDSFLPRSKEAIKDTVVSSAFVAMGVLMPGGMLDSNNFQVHLGGIAIGIGIGWLVKSIIFHKKQE